MRSLIVVTAALAACAAPPAAPPMPRIAVTATGFALDPGGVAFVPWGFNYDHDEAGRLIEDYWIDEWPKVEADFAEMKALGANVVRIHLQLGRFLPQPDAPDDAQLRQLERLLELAERVGLHLDLTGLGCYHKADVPDWYDALDEAGRWRAQAAFWEAVAKRAARSPAVFCYDLMNEPVVPAGKHADWLGPPFAGKHFVQFIGLDLAGRDRAEVARAWISTLSAAIRRHDARTPITVGLVDWSLERPGLQSGFAPGRVADLLDFLCVHLYPERGKIDDALEVLAAFRAAGRPVVIEETFPLKAGPGEFDEFLRGSKRDASGWIGFYWGATIEECRASGSIAGALTAAWLERFRRGPP